MFILLKEMGPWSVGGVDRASSPDALGSEFETHSVRKYHFFNIPRRAQRQISELSEGGRVKPKNWRTWGVLPIYKPSSPIKGTNK